MPDLDDHLAQIPHAAAIGMTLVSRSEGTCIVRVPYAEHLVGDPDTGVIHGGVITALLDNASGMAVRSEGGAPGEERSMATLDLRIDYMRPAHPRQDLIAEAHCYRMTSNVAFVRAIAYHDDRDDPIASSVATFMLGTPNGPRA
jgi:uncharacterized protein (TIGR00369 family)